MAAKAEKAPTAVKRRSQRGEALEKGESDCGMRGEREKKDCPEKRNKSPAGYRKSRRGTKSGRSGWE